jgi:hypothetical protein
MIFPRFNPNSFWSMQAAREVSGANCSAPPHGLITLAVLWSGIMAQTPLVQILQDRGGVVAQENRWLLPVSGFFLRYGSIP